MSGANGRKRLLAAIECLKLDQAEAARAAENAVAAINDFARALCRHSAAIQCAALDKIEQQNRREPPTSDVLAEEG